MAKKPHQTYIAAIENAPIHIVYTDTDGIIEYANPAVQHITGYKLKEIIGNTPALWGRQMSKKFYADMWKTIKVNQQSFSGQITNRRKNGQLYRAQVHIQPIFNVFGKLKGFVGIEQDLTQIEKAWAAVKARDNELEQFYELVCDEQLENARLRTRIKKLEKQRDYFIEELFQKKKWRKK